MQRRRNLKHPSLISEMENPSNSVDVVFLGGHVHLPLCKPKRSPLMATSRFDFQKTFLAIRVKRPDVISVTIAV
jgi:hypothetical protein